MTELSSNIKKGFFWNSLSLFASQGVTLLSIIILGRILSPEDFGLLGMFAIFIAISNMMIDSGMGGALIKKQDATVVDYSTLFLYNMTVSIILYVLLYFSAPIIANFYDRDILIPLIRVVGIVIIVHAFRIVQNVRILKELKFKALAGINFASGLISLTIAVFFAKKGYGVWALVIQQISMAVIATILSIIYNRLTLSFKFSITSFKEQFSFGINLLFSNLLNTLTNNVTPNVLAKITSLSQTGSFVQSNKLTGTLTSTINTIIDRTIFPVFAKIQDVSELKVAYIRLRKNVLSILFPLSILLALLAEPIVLMLLGQQWVDAVWMFQILSFSLLPLFVQMLCRSILKSRGNTKQIFINEIIRSTLLLLSIIVGIFLGLKFILWGIVISLSITSLWIMYSVSKEIVYNYWEYLGSTLSLISVSLLSYLASNYLLSLIGDGRLLLNVLIGAVLVGGFVLLFSFLFKQKEIFQLMKITFSRKNKMQ